MYWDVLFCLFLIANECGISSCLFTSYIFVGNILVNIENVIRGKKKKENVIRFFAFFLSIGVTSQVIREVMMPTQCQYT